MPAIRPRTSRGIDSFHIVVRKMPLIASAPPPTISPSIAHHSDEVAPKRATPSPHTPAATTTARP